MVPDTEKISENIFFFYFSIFYYTIVFLQANEELAKFGRPKSTPSKVKVQPGASASLERVPVKKERLMVIPEVDQKRDYAHFVLQQRLTNIDVRHKNDVMKLYLPYIQST